MLDSKLVGHDDLIEVIVTILGDAAWNKPEVSLPSELHSFESRWLFENPHELLWSENDSFIELLPSSFVFTIFHMVSSDTHSIHHVIIDTTSTKVDANRSLTH